MKLASTVLNKVCSIASLVLFGTLMVLIPDSALYAQTTPTVVSDNFITYDLFEYELTDEWYYLPESSSLSAKEALNSTTSFKKPSDENTEAGWWMLYLQNESSLIDFALRFMSPHDRLEVVKESPDGAVTHDEVGNEVLKPEARIQVRLLTTPFSMDQGSGIKILVRNRDREMRAPRVTLNRLTAVEDYSWSFEKMSLIFTVIFGFIFIYQMGMVAMVRSKSYAYYGLLAFGYFLHAINYQLDGWTTAAFTDDLSIISASVICIGGVCLWRRFLHIEQGPWYWLFRAMKAIGISIMGLVMAYLIFPSILPRFNEFASISAALLALTVISVWMLSSIVMTVDGRENAKSYLLTNVPILIGGLFFVVIWIGIRYEWIASASHIAITANLMFFGSAVVQLLLFSLVIGLAMKKRLVGSYKNEKQQKLFLEERVRERTAELEEMNDQLALKNQELSKINGTKNRLLTILSHDLRSPINNVASLVALLKEHQFSPEEFSSLIPELEKSIADTTNFMSLLIRWTQSQNDGFAPNKSKFEIQSVIDRNIRHLGSALEAKQLELKVDASGVEVFADQNMMDLVVRNLLSNAIKFSYPSGKIEINATTETDEEVCIEVVDEGMGIDGGRTKLFFDVTQKNTTMGTGGEKGFGMGLILSKDFAELNGGTLRFTSKKGEGSTFTVTIPSQH